MRIVKRHAFGDLAAYAERQLGRREVARVESHLSTCARCRVSLENIRRGIALASELRPEPMPEVVAGRTRARLQSWVPRSGRSWVQASAGTTRAKWLRRIAASILFIAMFASVVAMLVIRFRRPWPRLEEGRDSPAFEQAARRIYHKARLDPQLDLQSSEEWLIVRWLAAHDLPVGSFALNRSPTERARFVPIGAAERTVAGARAAIVEYRIDDRPVTLVIARRGTVPSAPGAGWLSKRIVHRRDADGVQSLSWTAGGDTYVLVSELPGVGQRACFICHTDARFVDAIQGMAEGR